MCPAIVGDSDGPGGSAATANGNVRLPLASFVGRLATWTG
jgi:hypothetical protein